MPQSAHLTQNLPSKEYYLVLFVRTNQDPPVAQNAPLLCGVPILQAKHALGVFLFCKKKNSRTRERNIWGLGYQYSLLWLPFLAERKCLSQRVRPTGNLLPQETGNDNRRRNQRGQRAVEPYIVHGGSPVSIFLCDPLSGRSTKQCHKAAESLNVKNMKRV